MKVILNLIITLLIIAFPIFAIIFDTHPFVDVTSFIAWFIYTAVLALIFHTYKLSFVFESIRNFDSFILIPTIVSSLDEIGFAWLFFGIGFKFKKK